LITPTSKAALRFLLKGLLIHLIAGKAAHFIQPLLVLLGTTLLFRAARIGVATLACF